MTPSTDLVSYIYAKSRNIDVTMEKTAFLKLKKVTDSIDYVRDLLRRGKATRHPHSTEGLYRAHTTPFQDSIPRSEDLNKVVNNIKNLHEKAEKNSTSFFKSYKGLFNSKSDDNPFQLYRKANKAASTPLGKGYNFGNSTLKEIGKAEVESLIFQALAKHSNNPKVDDFAEQLFKDKDKPNSLLKKLIKGVEKDLINGKDPSISIPNVNTGGSRLEIKVDRPIASFNGSPAFNSKKTFGFDNVDDFNKQHEKIIKEYKDIDSQVLNGTLHPRDPEYLKVSQTMHESQNFKRQFGDKIRLMDEAVTSNFNTVRITLDDLKSADAAKTFFKNPHASQGVTGLSSIKLKELTDEMVDAIEKATRAKGDKPEVVKEAIIKKLDDFAGNPDKSGFLDTFHFDRYTANEMKDSMGAIKGTKADVELEGLRVGSNAVGALGLAGLMGAGAYQGYKSIFPEKDTHKLGDLPKIRPVNSYDLPKKKLSNRISPNIGSYYNYYH